MALIKLCKTNEAGEGAGIIFVNADQTVAVSIGQNAIEIRMADGLIGRSR